jgi:predicted SAM-dependent methyltransferase
MHSLDFIEESSVEEIYSSHTLEYYDQHEVIGVLLELKRVLMPGGKLFVTVPDFRSLLSIYELTNSINSIRGPLFGRWPNNSSFIYHKSCWDKSSLTDVLEQTGFTSIREFSPITYLTKIDSSYDDHSLAFYPHKDINGIQVSLALTAVK